MAMDMYFGWVPAEAVAAVWMMAAAAAWVLFCPPRPSRRERRRQLLARETAWAPVFDEAREELDSADMLVPVLLRAPRRVR
jgi:hypothetical protein